MAVLDAGSKDPASTVILLLALAAPAFAQDAPLELQRLSAPIVVDGVPDEAAWRDVAPLPLTMYTPVFRGTPTQRSEIRVAYDDEHFYAAGWFYDTEPDQIRVNSLYRDRWNGDDTLAIYIPRRHRQRPGRRPPRPDASRPRRRRGLSAAARPGCLDPDPDAHCADRGR
jgi:hypothetical protein